MHANIQPNQREHAVLLAARVETFAATPLSPRTLGIIKCIDKGHIQGIRGKKLRWSLTAIEKLAIVRGHFYYEDALVNEKVNDDLGNKYTMFVGEYFHLVKLYVTPGVPSASLGIPTVTAPQLECTNPSKTHFRMAPSHQNWFPRYWFIIGIVMSKFPEVLIIFYLFIFIVVHVEISFRFV